MHSSRFTRRPFALLVIPLLAAPLAQTACGSSAGAGGGTGVATTTSGAGGVNGTGGDIGIGGVLDHGAVESLTIDPPTATLDLMSGTPGAQVFKATAHYADKTSATVNDASWSANGLALGAIDGSGSFAANGALGGVVTVSAAEGGQKATATLTIKLHVTDNSAGLDPATQTMLTQASAPDAAISWAYPYDATVFPRGIGGPPLMWLGGGAADVYYVHALSATFELEAFVSAPSSRYDIPAATWDQLTGSTNGAVELKVSRLAGGVATLIVDHHYSVAPSATRGSIYYWAINTGRVMRIKPGAAAPDDFIGPAVPCTSCHTVSANGAKVVMNQGNWPNETSVSYDIGAAANAYSGFSVNTGASEWALAGISADSKVIVENFAPLRGDIGVQTGAFDAATAQPIANTGLEGKQLWMPAFAPDDKLLAYVDPNTKDLRAYDWDEAGRTAANDRLIVAAGGDGSTNVIAFPTVSPDHKWILYQRSSALGSLGNAANLYLASVDNPGTEVALDTLDGTAYPFAAGDRDRHLDYEPTFAPVAAGGYFWVVFHSRRTFGNQLTGPAYVAEGNGTKQLWVAAIDQSPAAGKDASHPAFYLPGQDPTTLNMRGYWSLDPCKDDGKGCAAGTDCCGGYCDNGTCNSTSNGCSQSGDHCASDADCCAGGAGTLTCINSVCSDAPPH